MKKKTTYPELPSHINNRAKFTHPDGSIEYWTIIDEIRQNQNDEKIIVLQLLESEDKRRELRLGYYIIGKKPKNRGKWVWGQFCTMIPKKIFKKICAQTINRF